MDDLTPPPGRSFMDVPAARKAIYDGVFDAVSKAPPLSNNKHTLQVSDLGWDDDELPTPDKRKLAVLSGNSIDRRLRGTMTLVDNLTGKPLSSKKMTIARVPVLTDEGTFVLSGVNWSLANQSRLRPGAYVRRGANGEVTANVNPDPGTGAAHKYELDKKGVFKIRLQNSIIPLMPALRALGATDEQIKAQWGPELFDANNANPAVNALEKLADKLNPKRPKDRDAASIVRESFLGTPLDVRVTKRTLGAPHAWLTSDAILAATGKLARVTKNEEEPDDRDAMVYQRVLGPEDLMAERARQLQKILRPYFWRASNKGTLDAIQPNFFGGHIRSTITDSGLGQAGEEVNPIETLGQLTRISRLGYGGIPSARSAPEECYDDQTEVFTSVGWLPWSAVTDLTELATYTDGRMTFHKPLRLVKYDYEGPMFGLKTRTLDYLVTPGHRVWCRSLRKQRDGRRPNHAPGYAPWHFELASDVHRRPRQFLITHGATVGIEASTYTLPVLPKSSNGAAPVKCYSFDIDDWAEFVGWFAAEGSIDTFSLRERSKYHLTISQSSEANPEKTERIRLLLAKMGIKASYVGRNFVFVSKQIGSWLIENVGMGSFNKRLPEECFTWPVSSRRRLLESLILGDGNTKPNGASHYISTSRQLVEDVARLGTTLGVATSNYRPSTKRATLDKIQDREPNQPVRRTLGVHNVVYNCGLLISDVQGVTSERWYDKCYYTEKYIGKVYCAEVPGGLVYVRRNRSVGMWLGNSRNVQPSQLGFIDSIFSPESEGIGLDSRLSAGIRKGKDGETYIKMTDIRSGKPKWTTSEELADGVVALPGEMDEPDDIIKVLRNGKLDYAKKEEVTHAYPSMDDTFNPLTQLVALKSAAKANRTSMGGRMGAQALSLVNREAPLVRSGSATGSYQSDYGKYAGALRAEVPGQVTKIDKNSVEVRQDDGSIRKYPVYDNHVLNRKSFLRSEPVVRVGQRVNANDLLTKSNYTDDEGAVALGANLRTVYLPLKDKTYEDAVAVSESAAKKMTSEHAYQFDVDFSDADARKGKSAFQSLFPSVYGRDVLENFGDDGVIKVGTKVTKGMPLVLKAKANEYSHGKVSRGKHSGFSDQSEVWDHDDEGIVTDVVPTKRGVNVVVSSKSQFRAGDKIAGLHGDKGLAAEVIPDDEMPHDKDGNPYEMAVNSLTIVTRQNPSQMVEAALGKVAAKTGKPYDFRDWGAQSRNLAQFALEELQKNGLTDKEDVIDPTTGKTIPEVFTGVRYYMKLHHQGEAKAQGRGLGAYTQSGAPAKIGGKVGSSKRQALMESNALLSHGAFGFLRGAREIRSQKNPDFWAAFMAGRSAAPPNVSVHHDKFLNQLRGSGINPVRNGSKISLKALTDSDVDELAGDREITSPETVDFNKGMKPIPGGLFDIGITGGAGDNGRWSKISLAEPLPNPVFEDPIRRVLGLTQKGLREVIAGREELDGKTGPGAIKDALSSIDLDREIDRARKGWKSFKGANRDKLVKRWAMLAGAKNQGIHPSDWISTKVPVLPPQFRPVSIMTDNKLPLVSDPNYLYGDVFRSNESLKSLRGRTGDVGDERLALYDSYKAVVGLGDPITPKNQERGVKGLLASVFGSGPKYSSIQYRLLGGSVDTVGRAAIIPSNDLDMDEIGLPEAQAWETYTPFVVRRLVRQGVAGPRAADLVERRDPAARKALVDEMDERPVTAVRAPTLHRYGVMGFRPKLVKGNALKLPPAVYKGFGADNDGDQMNWHVPVSQAEVDDIYERMLPSRNLLAVKNFKVHQMPTNEFAAGIYRATSDKSDKPVRTFASYQDLLKAYKSGKIAHSDRVHVLD